MVSHCGFDFPFPGKWANDIDLFMCLYAICISSLGETFIFKLDCFCYYFYCYYFYCIAIISMISFFRYKLSGICFALLSLFIYLF